MQNFYIGGTDPLLSNTDYEQKIAQLQQLQSQLQAQRNSISQRTPTPIWDEIDTITSNLGEAEYQSISLNIEFQESQKNIANILTNEQLKMLKPIIERTENGRKALENHLSLLRKLRHQNEKQRQEEMQLWREYTQKHSDKTYAEFLKTHKQGLSNHERSDA
jgi:hypothetical protein